MSALRVSRRLMSSKPRGQASKQLVLFWLNPWAWPACLAVASGEIGAEDAGSETCPASYVGVCLPTAPGATVWCVFVWMCRVGCSWWLDPSRLSSQGVAPG